MYGMTELGFYAPFKWDAPVAVIASPLSLSRSGDIWPGIPLFTGTSCRSVGRLSGGPPGGNPWVQPMPVFTYFSLKTRHFDNVRPDFLRSS